MRAKYIPAEDVTIKRLYKKAWSIIEIAHCLHKEHGSMRTPVSVQQRLTKLSADGQIEVIGRSSIRFVTAEALAWVDATFNLSHRLSHQLELREHAPSEKKKKHTERAKAGNTKKSTVREVLGFARLKDKNEPNPSYAVLTARLARSGDSLLMFQSLLETAVSEGKTAIDVVDDLRLIAS